MMLPSTCMRMTLLLLVGTLCFGNLTAAQVLGCLPEPHTLPDDLQSTLEARVTEFLDAEAQGHWNDIQELLGKKGVASKSSYRQCLVSRMKEIQMVSFDLSTPNLYSCTTQMSLPMGTVDRVTAEQLLWYVRGTARFQAPSKTWVQLTQITAYRDQGQWYFIPPQRAMQEQWEKIHYTNADFVRDRQDEIELSNPSPSPIEITDVHVYMDRSFPSLRNIKLKVRNKTPKKVVALSLRIGDKSGSSEIVGPYQLEPEEELALEDSVAAYGDFCNGVSKHGIAITSVSFADGSKWELKKPATNEAVIGEKSQ